MQNPRRKRPHFARLAGVNKPTYLIDCSIFIFRAWYAQPSSIVNRDGHAVNAVGGFLNFVQNLLTNEEPHRMGFVFDSGLKTSFRHMIYPAYKANRPALPEELRRQFPWCREILTAMGLPVITIPGHEADDLIGTLADRERERGQSVVLVTGDKDLTQLVGQSDVWWDPGRSAPLDARGIEKRMGVRPEQVADQLALAGDRVDNIPGIPGVGMATAARLLRHSHSLEGLLADIPAIEHWPIRGARKLMRLVDSHQDAVRMARRLTGIDCDLPIPADTRLERQQGDAQALRDLLYHLDLMHIDLS